MEESEDTSNDELILKEASDRFEKIRSDDNNNRINYQSDTLFVYSPGNQWPDTVRSARRAMGDDLCLEFNQLKPFTAQVINDQLQNKPGIRVHAASGQASEDTAKVIQGLIRGIEDDSNAESVYDAAFRSEVIGGRGAWRVCSDYVDGNSFDQKLCIKPIQDMLSVYADLSYQQPDGSDRSFVFVTESMTLTEFKQKWPDADPSSWEGLDSTWSGADDMIIVADYYRRICKKRTMVLMSDGAQGFKDEMPTPPEGITITREREVEEYKVEWYTIAGGKQILAKYDWPGQYIPVIIVAGEDIILDGKRTYQGLIRHARDAQSMLNFGMTQQAIHLSLTPRTPWVMAEGQDEGHETMWRDANRKNFSALIYKPTTIGDQMAPPPQRTAPSLPDAGWINFTQQMLGMIKSTIGMYENSLGQRGQEQSGKAIIAREKQGDNATFNYFDRLAMGIRLTGKIIVDAIPTYYDTERLITVINPDDTKQLVRINQSGVLDAIESNDVRVGQYAVTVESGPSYATQKQESADKMLGLLQSVPQIGELAPDLVVKSLDVPDAEVLAERLSLMLPPQIQQSISQKNQGKNPPDPQMMAEMQQKDQQLEQAVQTMQAMEEQIKSLESEAQQKMAAVQIDADVKIRNAELEASLKESQAERDAQLELMKAQIQQETDIKKAELQRETDLQKAMIERMTKIELEAMTQQGETVRAVINAEATETQEPKDTE